MATNFDISLLKPKNVIFAKNQKYQFHFKKLRQVYNNPFKNTLDEVNMEEDTDIEGKLDFLCKIAGLRDCRIAGLQDWLAVQN